MLKLFLNSKGNKCLRWSEAIYNKPTLFSLPFLESNLMYVIKKCPKSSVGV